MLESIYVGMTGLLGFSRDLRVIANNTANLKTPGFKSSALQFSDLFYTGGNLSGGGASHNRAQVGFGLNTTGTTISFKQGELRQTGNDLDMAVDGQGLFVLRDANGKLSYTRDGQFQFNADGVLVSRGTGAKVMGLDGEGHLIELTFAGQKANPGKPTSSVKFSGNLLSNLSNGAEQTVGGVKVVDATGGTHTLSLKLTSTSSTLAGSWQVEVMDGTTVVGSGQLVFGSDGKPQPDTAVVSFSYAPEGQRPTAVSLDFTTDVTSFAAQTSTLAMASQDGIGPGSMTGAAFDASGALTISYSNGQTQKGAQLAFARFDSPDAVGLAGDNQFEVLDERAWHLGTAGQGAFGNVHSGMVEISNVDLSQEFSNLVVTQRGYQASSQIISTSNDMLQELFSMKSK